MIKVASLKYKLIWKYERTDVFSSLWCIVRLFTVFQIIINPLKMKQEQSKIHFDRLTQELFLGNWHLTNLEKPIREERTHLRAGPKWKQRSQAMFGPSPAFYPVKTSFYTLIILIFPRKRISCTLSRRAAITVVSSHPSWFHCIT